MEKLRVDTRVVACECIGTLTPHQHETLAFMQVYLLKYNNVPNFNKNDFIEYYWLKPKEVLERITVDDSCKGDLPLIVQNLLVD